MLKHVHRIAGVIAPLCVLTFFLSTVVAELFGTPASVAQVKSLVVFPGLWIMIPAVAAAGASGMFMARTRGGRLVAAKRRRTPLIAANGLLVLVPCALVLDRWAAAQAHDAFFYVVQAIELTAGAANAVLMGLNLRDGLRMAGRLREQRDSLLGRV